MSRRWDLGLPQVRGRALRGVRRPARWQRSRTPTTFPERVALVTLALVAGLLYGWHLERQGWGNAYYAATAQAGAASWKAFYFGSVDAGNALATDKPPIGLWPMAASVRVFGLSSWSVLGPQLVEAVLAVVVLVRTVRRHSGPAAGLVAGVILASTPVFVVLARYDDPDMMVTLLAVCVAYTTLRYLGRRHRGWMATTGALWGLLFLTKWGAGLLIVPACLAVVWCSRALGFRREAAPLLLAAGVAAAVTALWLPATLLVPARWRPYEDASAGSVVNLVLGQNGFSRMVTRIPGSPTASAVSGTPGPLRLFQPPFTGQVGWLLPLALVLCVVPVVRSRGRGGGTAWGAGKARLFWTWWLSATGLVFSAMGGPMHPYYTVLMAPAIAALAGAGLVDLWRAASVEQQPGAGAVLAVALGGSGLWAAHTAWPGLPLVAGVLLAVLLTAAVAWAVAGQRRARTGAAPRVGAALVGSVAISAMLAGPVSYSLATDAHPVTGGNPLAGPDGGHRPVVYPPALVAFVRAHAGGSTWAAVTPRATAASTLALASRRPVLTLGGFTGRVPFPTLALVERWVRLGRVRYLVVPRSAVAAVPSPGAVHSEADRIVAWSDAHGCRVALAVREYVVEDLAGHTCGARGVASPGWSTGAQGTGMRPVPSVRPLPTRTATPATAARWTSSGSWSRRSTGCRRLPSGRAPRSSSPTTTATAGTTTGWGRSSTSRPTRRTTPSPLTGPAGVTPRGSQAATRTGADTAHVNRCW
jgi:4-amino-4-deoxy-L-arabinose transferase-like glycosyltransferase